MPFGMIQWSPDLNSRGYQYRDARRRAGPDHRVQPHPSERGGLPRVSQDFPFMPTTAPLRASPAPADDSEIRQRFASSFNHAHERARPGMYEVRLDPGQHDRRTPS